MPRQLGISRKRRSNRQAPAFVGVAVLGCSANGKCRHFVEKEIQAVVVVDDNGNVRLYFVEPLMDRFEPIEEVFPIWVVVQSPRDSFANGGGVRRCDAANYFRHTYSTPARTSISLNCSSV